MEDADFEVTADMLIHEDVDDESTLEEEEAFQTQEENQEELTDLQEESEIPLEVLLSRYGYTFQTKDKNEEEEEKEERKNSGDVTTTGSSSVLKQTTRLKQNLSQMKTSTITSNTTTNIAAATTSQAPSSTATNIQTSSSENTPSASSPSLSGTQLASGSTYNSSDDFKRSDDNKSTSHVQHLNHQIDKPVDDTSKTGQASSPSVSPHLTYPPGLSRLPPPLIQVLPESEELLQDPVMVGGHQLETALGQSSMVTEDVLLASSGRGVLGKHGRSQDGEAVDDHDAVYSDVMFACGESPISSETDEPSYRPSSSSKASMANNNQEDKSSDPISSRLRSELPERRSIRLMNSSDRLLMENYLYLASLLEEEEEGESDEEYVPRDEWRKEVKVGQRFQAIISDHPSCPPYSTECPPNVGELVWNPQGTSSGEVSQYLESISEVVTGSQNSGERDNEQALQVFQECNYNAKKAAEKIRTEGVSQGMLPWTEEECRNFEEGLQMVGKDFFTIKKKVPSRTVKEIVEFYYLWKKSERYDVFLSQYGKIGKKKIICPPGHISDFMEKYFDLYDNDAVDLHYGTTTVYAEVKKDNS